MHDMHGSEPPSPWVCRWSPLIAPAGQVLDLACGAGRHLRWLRSQGHRVIGVDRSGPALAACARLLAQEAAGASQAAPELLCADLENGPWPFAGRQFAAVVVTNYLWRPLLAPITASLAPGGVLIYESFAQGNETVGRPARAEFLLAPGELLAACARLRVVAYEDGFLPAPARFVQRIAALREPEQTGPPARYCLLPAAPGAHREPAACA